VSAWLRLGAGVLALGGAAALGASSSGPDVDDPAAALGGGRTIASGVLFLRAETLRREGRVDDVAAVYRRILEMDPGNDAGTDFLASTLARDLLPLAPTPEGRVRWWREAFGLVERGLARKPNSARLLFRRADLLLREGRRDPAVADSLAAQGRDVAREGFDSLLAVLRLGPDIPGVGRIHLDLLARLAPRLAAERLARGSDASPFLAGGEEALARAGPVLAEITLDPGDPASAADRLRAGIRLVQEVRAARGGSAAATESARAVLDTYVRVLGEDEVTQALRPLLP
jgi:hypothetical protein